MIRHPARIEVSHAIAVSRPIECNAGHHQASRTVAMSSAYHVGLSDRIQMAAMSTEDWLSMGVSARWIENDTAPDGVVRGFLKRSGNEHAASDRGHGNVADALEQDTKMTQSTPEGKARTNPVGDDARQIALEQTLMHLQYDIEQLNRAILAQQAEFKVVKDQLARLELRLEQMQQPPEVRDLESERPRSLLKTDSCRRR